jgi:predicted dehydrogenase
MTGTATGGAVIVGAGLMGRWHANAIRAEGRPVTAVVDADAGKAAVLARSVDARPTTDLSLALSLAPVAVHICTPPSSHVAIATAALEAGAHVLIEKPFAETAHDAREILDLATRAGRMACPVHQFLFQNGVRQAIERLDAIGPLLHADFVACSAGADGSPGRQSALVHDILPHPLSLLARFVSPLLSDARWKVVASQPGELRIAGSLGHVSIGILISASGRPTRNTARLIGRHGAAHLDLFHGFATFEAPDVSRGRKIARPFIHSASTLAAAGANLARRAVLGQPAYPGLNELTQAFYAAISVGAPAPISGEETLAVATERDRLAAMMT